MQLLAGVKLLDLSSYVYLTGLQYMMALASWPVRRGHQRILRRTATAARRGRKHEALVVKLILAGRLTYLELLEFQPRYTAHWPFCGSQARPAGSDKTLSKYPRGQHSQGDLRPIWKGHGTLPIACSARWLTGTGLRRATAILDLRTHMETTGSSALVRNGTGCDR